MRTLLILIFACSTIHGLSQRDSVELEDGTLLYNLPKKRLPKNAFFIEAGGNAGIYSFNYDRILINHEKFRTSIRGGFAYMPFLNDHNADLIFVAEHNFLFGKENSFIEAGLGLNYVKTLGTASDNGNYFSYISEQGIGVFRLGYRFQERRDEGLFFRAALTPYLIQTNSEDRIEPIFQFWLGISAGANF